MYIHKDERAILEMELFRDCESEFFNKIEFNQYVYSLIFDALNDYNPKEPSISPFYFHRKKAMRELVQNKEKIRTYLDKLRMESERYSPQEIILLGEKGKREKRGIENFSGIYIIHNIDLDFYYVGQSEAIFNRIHSHFKKSIKNSNRQDENNKSFYCREIEKDYSLGHEFEISLIPLEQTKFESLNELEFNAIGAYDSEVPSGYNRTPGNLNDKPIFKNENQEMAADLILSKIIDDPMLKRLSNSKKRYVYVSRLFDKLEFPSNPPFLKRFAELVKWYRKTNKEQ